MRESPGRSIPPNHVNMITYKDILYVYGYVTLMMMIIKKIMMMMVMNHVCMPIASVVIYACVFVCVFFLPFLVF